MQFTEFSQLDLKRVPSPCFVIDEVAIERNLKILNALQRPSGAKVLHALKAFSLWSLAPLTNKYLSGTCSSGLHEALLGKEYYGGEKHVFSAAFSHDDFQRLISFADHIIFNSCSQLLQFKTQCERAKKIRPELQFGLRVNPEHSESTVPLYDPCSEGSHLGITREQLNHYLVQDDFMQAFALISGLHFHTLCEKDFPPLQRTLAAVEEKFSGIITNMAWINFGGGHHITSPDYQANDLVDCVKQFRAKYSLDVYLEPGEAIAIGSGVLVTEILDIRFNHIPHVILDASATCHMPDTLEMPYRPTIIGEISPTISSHTYRFGGQTCLAGDVMGEYSFAQPLKIGDRLMFSDMAHYTMVKTSTFNGTKLPAIAIWNSLSNEIRVVREFSYDDFKSRLS